MAYRYLRRLTIGAFAGTRNPATRNPSSLAEGAIREWAFGHNFECILLCGALATAERRETSGFAEQTDTSDSATIYFLGALGRRRCRKRTPGPPPFSSMNSTPAASKVRRTAKSLAVVIDVSSSVSSARLIVVTLRAVSRARSSALQRMSARAALI